ncbi:MAG: hypothetical protein PHC94_04850 [Methylobacter sp.]|nr:hypothetical protein [Methylobacter sp.]
MRIPAEVHRTLAMQAAEQ